MSAMGQKRTLFTASLYVRLAPGCGHSRRHRGNAKDAELGATQQVRAGQLTALRARLGLPDRGDASPVKLQIWRASLSSTKSE